MRRRTASRFPPRGETAAALLIARTELRRQRASIALIALLVAVTGGAVLGALNGAERTETSVDNFRRRAAASDASYQSNTPEQADVALAAARTLPQVADATERYIVNAFLVDGAISDIAIYTDPDGAFGTTIERPALLAGRMPDPGAPDEILLNEQAAQLTGVSVGGRLRARTWSDTDLDALFSDTTFPGFNGPELDLRVVGVGRTLEELPGEVRRTSPNAIASPAFLGAHPHVGAWPAAVVVRLRHGASDIDAVTAGLQDALGDLADGPLEPTTAGDVYLDTANRTVDSLAIGLVMFALGAGVAGAIAIGQAVDRYLAAGLASERSVVSLGATGSFLAFALTLPVFVAGALGMLSGTIIATLVSPLFPLGLARRAVIDPGVSVRLLLLVGGAVAVLVALVAWCSIGVRRLNRRRTADDIRVRSSAAVRAAARAGLSPTWVLGLRMAEGRRRSVGVPIRSAIVAVAIGIAGVVGAGVVAVSFSDVQANPARWGWNWSTVPDYFGDADERDVEGALVADDRVDGVGRLLTTSMLIDGQAVSGFAIVALEGDMSLTRVSGRLPSGPGEVALGRRTMRRLGVSVGDRVTVEVPDQLTRELDVVGVALLPPTEGYSSDIGAAFTPDTLTTFAGDGVQESLAITYAEGADPAVVEAGLAADHGLDFSVFSRPQTPGAVRNLAEARTIGIALGGFFGLVGLAGLAHALSVSTRRRLGELTVLRALGLRRRQVRLVVVVQALALGCSGLAVGVFAGLIAGRALWWLLAQDAGAIADPRTPWPILVATVLCAVGSATALGWWAGRSLRHRLTPRAE